MIEEFLKRGLCKTVDFLTKAGYREESVCLALCFDEYSALTSFNLKEYSKVYASLPCTHFAEDALVFCGCYKSSLVFLRNYALLIKNKHISKVTDLLGDKDEFLLYLEAIVHNNDKDILRAAIRKNELFWEAYELLNDTVDVTTAAGKKLRNLFHMFLLSTKNRRIDHEIDLTNANLAAATLYSSKEYKKSEEIFEKVTSSKVFDLDYIDLYSNILYLKKDSRLGLLAHRMLKINSYRPETHITIGNYHSLRNEHAKAIECFLKAIELNPRYSISYTLVGHEYMEMKNIMNAIKFYTKSIQANADDYRAWFGAAQAYSSLKMYEYSLIFFKKSVEMKPEDGFLWLTMGQVYTKLKREEALKCFSRAIGLNEVEGFLHSADFYKTIKKYTEAVKYYEKYVDKNGKDAKRICAFLSEYFAKIGNKRKAETYGQQV